MCICSLEVISSKLQINQVQMWLPVLNEIRVATCSVVPIRLLVGLPENLFQASVGQKQTKNLNVFDCLFAASHLFLKRSS